MVFTEKEGVIMGTCIVGFFYGLYTGIFIIYLQCASKESRTTTILFYALCLLYVLSTATLASDLVAAILQLSYTTFPPQRQIDLHTYQTIFAFDIVQVIAVGCCNFIAQCIIIYRCWIVWGQNIRIVIIPSFLAITYIATWLASIGAQAYTPGQNLSATWGFTLTVTALATSMAVNTLVTGLIVFRILRVFLEAKAANTSVERTLGAKFRHSIFVIIESGMALFSIQLVSIVLENVELRFPPPGPDTVNLIGGISQMINGITPTIIIVRVTMKLSFDDEESFKEAVGSLCFNNPPSDPNTSQRVGSSSSMPPQPEVLAEERRGREDICFNDPSSHGDLNAFRRIESSSSMPPEGRGEDIFFNNPSLASDPNTLPRMGGSSSMPSQDSERSDDTYILDIQPAVEARASDNLHFKSSRLGEEIQVSGQYRCVQYFPEESGSGAK